MASWSDLNNDALEHILLSLTLPDHHRFSVVCRNWRWVVKNKHKHSSPAQQLPWVMMCEDASTKKHKFYSLTEDRHYYIHIPELRDQYWIGSSYGWLFTVDKTFVPRLFNPFTRDVCMPPPLPRFEEHMLHESFIKAILSHDPSKTHAFTVLLLYGRDTAKVAFWQGGENTWTCIPCEHHISDTIFFGGKFYFVSDSDLLVIPDLGSNPTLTSVMPLHVDGVKYLVDFMGYLLLVERHRTNMEDGPYLHYVTTRFDVHFLNFEVKRPYQCAFIGDYAIFLGNCNPLVVDSHLFPGCKRNSIYFTDMDCKPSPEVHGYDDLGVYYITKDTIEPYYPRTVSHPYPERSVWLTPNSNQFYSA